MSVVTIVYNPASGSAIGRDELEAAFGAHANGQRLHWSPTTEDDPGVGQATEAADGGSDVVIACGGDGTVRAVLEGLTGSRTALGVVPLGTGNLLAANLDLPDGLDAIPVALSANPRRLDVGSINGERFAVMAGVGFDALMIRDANPAVKRRLGSAAYVASAAKHLPARIVRAEVAVDGTRVFDGRTAMVLVGNCGEVTGGLEVFPGADPADGELEIAVLTAERPREWARVLWNLVTGKPQPDALVRRSRGREVEIRLDRPVPYELDGEDRPPTDRLHVTIEAAALEVRCP